MNNINIKLIIWDLDNTLWDGILSQNNPITIFQNRIDFIRKSINHGIVHSICSKNDFETTKLKLQELNIWDLFVFPHIQFTPKGEAIKEIIENMNLRPDNTLFIDDTTINLKEAQFISPELNILNATDNIEPILNNILESIKNIKTNRMEQYRILENKNTVKKNYSNEDFLLQSEIKITVIRNHKNLEFVDRIHELINRSNQLNFTESRIEKEQLIEEISDSNDNLTFSVFVWDKYGSYGLVGFVSVYKKESLTHFVFSCRIMNMGIEQKMFNWMKKTYPKIRNLLRPQSAEWVTIVNSDDVKFLDQLKKAHTPKKKPIRVIANCSSGVIAHYLGKLEETDVDAWPDTFVLENEIENTNKDYTNYQIIVYTVFNDYAHMYWKQFSLDRLAMALTIILEKWKSIKVFLLLASEHNFPGKTENRSLCLEDFINYNKIVRDIAFHYPNVKTFEMTDYVNNIEQINPRHYMRPAFKRVCEKINQL